MVAELDRYADLQRAMAAAKDAADADRSNLLAGKQAALEAQAGDYDGQLAVSLAVPAGTVTQRTQGTALKQNTGGQSAA